MSIEWVGERDELPPNLVQRYQSPQELLRADEAARRTLGNFLQRYACVGKQKDLPVIERVNSAGENQTFPHEMFTGFGGLGELVHIRVDPFLADDKEGYFVARGNLQTGEVSEPEIRCVERFYDSVLGPQTAIYFEDDRCESWPAEYQPMIHFAQRSGRFVHKAGFGAGDSLLRPIALLAEALEMAPATIPVPRAAEPMGQRALTLVHSAS